ncbi:hypothetical protein [Variovorax sp. YR752]|uniref:hypothetical protein n=1 Tax=Variovorax sp. YR752 TaxID=1884383 RepID=UPI003137FBA4
MQILRVFVAVCLAAMGVAMLCVALLSALDAAVILFSYDKVEGVVTGAGNTEVRVDYVRPDGRRAVLYARSGGKFDARPVGKKVAVLLPPKDRLDGTLKPILKDDLNPVAMEFMFAVLFLVGALVIWEGRSGGASSQSSEDLRTRGVDTHPKDPERPVRPQASTSTPGSGSSTGKRACRHRSTSRSPSDAPRKTPDDHSVLHSPTPAAHRPRRRRARPSLPAPARPARGGARPVHAGRRLGRTAA